MLSQFHLGPEVTQRSERVTWFARALPGYSAWSLGNFGGGSFFYGTQGGFSLATGGGADLHAGRKLDIRLQADYMPAWFRQGTPNETVASKLPPLESPYGNFRLGLFFLGTGYRADRPDEKPETERTPTYQFGGGPSYMRSGRLNERNDFGGAVIAASWAQNRCIRWIGDVGLEFAGSPFKTAPPANVALAQDLYQFHAGPEFTRRSTRRALFAHVLPGLTWWVLSDNKTYGVTPYKQVGFSLEAGGGMEWRQTKHLDVRLQADYIPVWLHQSNPTSALNAPVPPVQTATGNFRVAVVLLKAGSRPASP
jgi:hypothetical protein